MRLNEKVVAFRVTTKVDNHHWFSSSIRYAIHKISIRIRTSDVIYDLSNVAGDLQSPAPTQVTVEIPANCEAG
jgi:hypothetical protein